MDNGCVCCTVRGDLVKAFQTLSRRKEKYDAVIIETTGACKTARKKFLQGEQEERHAQQHIVAPAYTAAHSYNCMICNANVLIKSNLFRQVWTNSGTIFT